MQDNVNPVIEEAGPPSENSTRSFPVATKCTIAALGILRLGLLIFRVRVRQRVDIQL